MILKYCDMFLKLKDLCDSAAFKEADLNKDGTIFPKDFKDQLEKSKKYSLQEVHFLISCNQETNHEGKIDYVEFVEAYYDSAKGIGFNLAVLFTNLSEHMPTDPRLARSSSISADKMICSYNGVLAGSNSQVNQLSCISRWSEKSRT